MKANPIASVILAGAVVFGGMIVSAPAFAKAPLGAEPSKRELRQMRRAERRAGFDEAFIAERGGAMSPINRDPLRYSTFPAHSRRLYWGPGFDPLWVPGSDDFVDPVFGPFGPW